MNSLAVNIIIMKFNRVYSSLTANPQKLIALILFLIGFLLFINEILNYWQLTHVQVVIRPVSTQQVRNSVINSRSPLFAGTLFGTYVPVNLGDADIKQSQLDVQLVGIMYSDKEKDSQVIIRSASGIEQYYMVGDTLPGGAIIKRITRQEIVVLHNGSLESLSLPKNELIFDVPAKPLIEE